MISKQIVVGDVSMRTAAENHHRILNHRIVIASYVVKQSITNCAKDETNEDLLFLEKIFYYLKKKYVSLPKRNPLWQERATRNNI